MEEQEISEDEIEDVLMTGKEFHGKSGRRGKFKVFDYKRKREGRFYQQKRIEVIYAHEGNTLVTITAYSFFGKWE